MLAGGQLASWAFGVLWLVFVPRTLGPTAMGEFVIAISVSSLFGVIVNQGAAPFVTREIARDNDRAPVLVGATIAMRLLTTVPACVLLVLVLPFMRFGTEQTLLIWLASALVVTAAVSGALETAFASLERMEYLAYSSLVGNGLVSLLGITLVLLGGGVVPLLILDLGLTILVLALNLRWSRGVFTIAWRGAVRLAPYVFRAGLSYWIGGLFFTAYLCIDAVILSKLAPAEVVGWYGMPVQAFTSVLMVATVLSTAWFPRLAAAHKRGSGDLQQTARPAVEATVVLSLPIAAGIALVASPVITWLYGPGFLGSIPVLILLGFCVVPTYLNIIAFTVFQAEGRQVTWFKVIAAATAVNIGLNLVLIPHFQAGGNGAIGAAVSLLVTEVVQAACALAMLPWLLRAPLASRLLRAGLATGFMSLVVVAASPVGVIAQVTAGIVSFGLCGALLRLAGPAEIAELRGLGARIRDTIGLRRAAA